MLFTIREIFKKGKNPRIAAIFALFAPMLVEGVAYLRMMAGMEVVLRQEDPNNEQLFETISMISKLFPPTLWTAVISCGVVAAYAFVAKKIDRWFYWIAALASIGWFGISVYWLVVFSQSDRGGIYLALLIVIWGALIANRKRRKAGLAGESSDWYFQILQQSERRWANISFTMDTFSPEITKLLGFYVYIYLDPRSGEIFYVGKGVGNRAFSHLDDQSDSEKVARIADIRSAGFEPRIEILRHGLTEDQAFLVEASAIDLLGLGELTNKSRGHYAKGFGRISATDVLLTHTAKPAHIVEPMVLILINRLYQSGMSEIELLEATRGIWKVGIRREKAGYACAVYQGVIREVYEVQKWHPAGTLSYSTRDDSEFKESGRWEFIGQRASGEIRSKYVRKSVRHLLGASAQNPVRYVNC